jgi:hypothetical protein
MSCCSQKKKRWPLIVFLAVAGSVILIAVLADAQTSRTESVASSVNQTQITDNPDNAQACSGHKASEQSCCAKPPQSP